MSINSSEPLGADLALAQTVDTRLTAHVRTLDNSKRVSRLLATETTVSALQYENSNQIGTSERVSRLLASPAGINVLAELAKIDPENLVSTARVEYLSALEKQSGWLQALMQRAIVAVAGDEPTESTDSYSHVDEAQREEIATALKLSGNTAQIRIDVARTLTQFLPETCAALANGEISAAQATVIARESAEIIRTGIGDHEIRSLELNAIAHSEFHTPAQVANKMRSLIAKLSPKDFEEVASNARDGRMVCMYPQPHGMAQIVALLPAVEAQTVMLAIDKLARKNQEIEKKNAMTLVAGAGAGELEQFIGSLDQHRADALAQIAGSYLSETADEALHHGRPTTINLTIDLPTVLGFAENPGILSGYGAIPASVARELAMNGKWRRFVTDPLTGNLLDYGRERYEPPQALMDFIAARDRVCRFPGCRQPARLSDIDHAHSWETGGETSSANMGLLCRRHHRMKTHGGWLLESFPDGSCNWTSPSGRKYFVEARPVNELA